MERLFVQMLRRVRSFGSLRRNDHTPRDAQDGQVPQYTDKPKRLLSRTLSLRGRTDGNNFGARLGRQLSFSRRQDVQEPRTARSGGHKPQSVPQHRTFSAPAHMYDSSEGSSSPDYTPPDYVHNIARYNYVTGVMTPAQSPSSRRQSPAQTPPSPMWRQRSAAPALPTQWLTPHKSPKPPMPPPTADRVFLSLPPSTQTINRDKQGCNAELVSELEQSIDELCQRLETRRTPPSRGPPPLQPEGESRVILSYADAAPPYRSVGAERQLNMVNTSSQYRPEMLQAQRASIMSIPWESLHK